MTTSRALREWRLYAPGDGFHEESFVTVWADELDVEPESGRVSLFRDNSLIANLPGTTWFLCADALHAPR